MTLDETIRETIEFFRNPYWSPEQLRSIDPSLEERDKPKFDALVAKWQEWEPGDLMGFGEPTDSIFRDYQPDTMEVYL